MALLSAVLGAAVLLPVVQDFGAGGLTAVQAAPVDPTPSRRPTTIGKPSPSTTATVPDPTTTVTATDPPDTSTGTASATDPATSDPTGTSGSGGSGGSTGGPSAESVDNPPQTAAPAPLVPARATTPNTAASPVGGGGNGAGGGNGNNGGNGNAGDNGNGVGSASAVAVEGRKVAAPTGDGRSSRDVDEGLAAGTLTADGSPTSSDSPSAGSSSGDPTDSATSATPGPDRADVPTGDDAIPDTWRLAAIVAVFVGGLAVALLIAAARPRSGAHRRH